MTRRSTRSLPQPALDDIVRLDQEVLGKRGTLTVLKTLARRSPDIDERKAAGRALNEATSVVAAALDERAPALGRRAPTRASPPSDSTSPSSPPPPRRGHSHPVTQAWERLEDVFIGLGFTVAEGPEVETDWLNFEALNMPASHPARTEFDTMFVDHAGAPPRHRPCCGRTRRPCRSGRCWPAPPPLYIIAPGRVFRRDTPDATHMPVFHQIEGLVVDRGINLGHLAGTIEAFTKAYFGEGFTQPPATELLPVHRAVRASSTSASRTDAGWSSAGAAWSIPTCCAPVGSTPRSGAGSPSDSASTGWRRNAIRRGPSGDVHRRHPLRGAVLSRDMSSL